MPRRLPGPRQGRSALRARLRRAYLLLDGKRFQLLAALDGCRQPPRPIAATSPCLIGVLRIAIKRRQLAALEGMRLATASRGRSNRNRSAKVGNSFDQLDALLGNARLDLGIDLRSHPDQFIECHRLDLHTYPSLSIS